MHWKGYIVFRHAGEGGTHDESHPQLYCLEASSNDECSKNIYTISNMLERWQSKGVLLTPRLRAFAGSMESIAGQATGRYSMINRNPFDRTGRRYGHR